MNTKTISDTPRTDKVSAYRSEGRMNLCLDPERAQWVSINYARQLERERTRLIAALVDAYETLNEYADVKDGPEGTQRPNAAMSQAGHIEELLKELGE
jgi:hypothetical protein